MSQRASGADAPPIVIDSPQSSNRRFAYNPALDGIRAFAVVAVMLFHGGVLTGGYLGVDAFFVLSGFLITSLIIDEIAGRGRLDRVRFWARRARRLLPALFLMLFAVCAYALVFAQRSELDRIRGDALATVFYAANWHAIASGHGYWDLFAAPSPLEHMWSLAIEEQFYIVWPFVIVGIVAFTRLVGRRRNNDVAVAPIVFAVSVAAGVASAIWCTVLFRADDTSRAYLGTDSRVGAILFGGALAAWIMWRGTTSGRVRRVVLEVAASVALIAVGWAWVSLDGQDLVLYRGGLALCGLGVVVVIAAVAHPERGPLHRVFAWRPFVAIGLISYGLYLWHWPLYVLLDQRRTGLDGNALLALRFAVTFAVAIASYFLVERPIRHHPLPRRLNFVIVPLTVCALISTIYLTTADATTSGRPSAELFAGPGRVDLGDSTIDAAGATVRSILVVGDSVAGNIATAAQKLQAEFGIRIGDATSAGCVLPGATAARTTINARTQTVSFNRCADIWYPGADQFDAGRVLLVYGTAAAFTDLQIDGRWVGACDGAYQEWYVDGLRSVIGRIAPEVPVRLAIVPAIGGTWIPTDANVRIDCINRAHERVARSMSNVSLIDLAEVVCPQHACRDSIGTEPFRIDGFHYSAPAAEFVARALIARVRDGTG